jgi:asparagine synthase (glutamine-hydrolysing)
MDVLVLPDNEVAQVFAEDTGVQVIRHDSGRPWLAGHWAEGEIDLFVSGSRRLAISGCGQAGHAGRAGRDAAQRELSRARSLRDLDHLIRALPGSFHVFASFGGTTRSQGTVSTRRQIFYAQIAGMTMASTGPSALTAIMGARLDEDTLALRLLSPVAPWPLSLRSVWCGVRQLAVGCWLQVDRDGGHRAVNWWHPPRDRLPRAEAAGAVRAVLRDAVAARTSDRAVVSADLSGGLDSTSLCFLAATTGARLLTYHWRPLDPANDDSRWAETAAGYLPNAQHRVIGPDEAPAWFGTGSGHGDPEGPLVWSRNRRNLEYLAKLDAAGGSGLHLIGVGGDELFGALPGYVWSLFRKHPVNSVPVINRYRAVNRWALGSTIRGLADRSSFAESLAATADRLTTPAPGPSAAPLGWRGPVSMPSWVTPGAAERVRDLLRQAAAAGPAPLDDDRAQHQVLESLVLSGGALRQLASAFGGLGVEWDAPFLDDRVIDVALSVRVEDRIAPGRYKPVLTAAMRGTTPDVILDRRSKGEYSAEAFDGLRRNRQALLRLCDGLHLEALGLVDAGALRAALTRLGPEARHVNPLENTLACEAWLRSVTPVPAGGR